MTDTLTTLKRVADLHRDLASQRDAAVVAARADGHPWRTIAAAAGLSVEGVRVIVARHHP